MKIHVVAILLQQRQGDITAAKQVQTTHETDDVHTAVGMATTAALKANVNWHISAINASEVSLAGQLSVTSKGTDK